MTYQGIIERVRAATGADRDLDEALRIHFGYPPKPWNYTGSTDAALALAEKLLPGWWIQHLGQVRDGWAIRIERQGLSIPQSTRLITARTAPLAIVLATLLALQSQEPK